MMSSEQQSKKHSVRRGRKFGPDRRLIKPAKGDPDYGLAERLRAADLLNDDDAMRRVIEEALAAANGSRARAAYFLGLVPELAIGSGTRRAASNLSRTMVRLGMRIS